MLKSEIKIADIRDIFSANDEAHKKFGDMPWWRGLSSTKWELLPGLLHLGRARDEASINLYFRRFAKIRYAACPQDDDYAEWLFLMQHYGLPTRLMDWSLSPLIALFFAVSESVDTGALWCLCPSKLNSIEEGLPGIIDTSYKEVSSLLKATFAKKKGDKSPKRKQILAIMGDHFDTRHLMQKSVFTLHGNDVPLDKHKSAGDFLIKFEIPSDSKKKILIELDRLSINELNLFPDLNHLADDLKKRKIKYSS